jgi:hypothetical protein
MMHAPKIPATPPALLAPTDPIAFGLASAAPDAAEARMIGLCAAYLPALARCAAESRQEEHDALWLKVEPIEEAFRTWEPATVQGLVAAAQVYLGFVTVENPQDAGLGDWPEKMARAVVRLSGGAAAKSAPAYPADDAARVALCNAHLAALALYNSDDDAAMMALCDAHLADLALYNTGHGPDGEGPLWDRIESTGAKLREWEPRTFAGVLKAAQMVEAMGAKSPDISAPWDSNYTRHWPETALRALLRIGGAA